MKIGRIVLTALLASALAVSACGLKGDPIRPGSEKDVKKQQSGT